MYSAGTMNAATQMATITSPVAASSATMATPASSAQRKRCARECAKWGRRVEKTDGVVTCSPGWSTKSCSRPGPRLRCAPHWVQYSPSGTSAPQCWQVTARILRRHARCAATDPSLWRTQCSVVPTSDNQLRVEEDERAELLGDIGYDVSLCLGAGDAAPTFSSQTTVDFRCSRDGADTFVNLT